MNEISFENLHKKSVFKMLNKKATVICLKNITDIQHCTLKSYTAVMMINNDLKPKLKISIGKKACNKLSRKKH